MFLSNTRLRFLKPVDKPYRLTDGGGLSLEVRPSGALLWRFRYRLGGRENVFAIGSYPEISLKQARRARDEARELIKRGIHPAHQRRTDRVRLVHGKADTFETVAREWLAANRPKWTPRTHRQREQLLERDVFPYLGRLAIPELTPARGVAVLKRIEARAPQMAVMAGQSLAAISRFAVETLRTDVDFGYPLRRAVRARPTQHSSALSPDQIPEFFAALEGYGCGFPTKAAIRVLWLTLAQSKQILQARWREFDLGEARWTSPSSPTKTGGRYTVPLSRQAVALLERLEHATGSGEYLFPNRSDPRRHVGHSLLTRAVSNMGYSGKLTPHGIRVTGRTILAEQGHARACEPGAALDARRAAMQQWADHLDQLCTRQANLNDRLVRYTG